MKIAVFSIEVGHDVRKVINKIFELSIEETLGALSIGVKSSQDFLGKFGCIDVS